MRQILIGSALLVTARGEADAMIIVFGSGQERTALRIAP
jgi:hypothetical protein